MEGEQKEAGIGGTGDEGRGEKGEGGDVDAEKER